MQKGKPKQLDRSQFTEEERGFIDLYHRICLPTGLGFLSVTERSKNSTRFSMPSHAVFDEKQWTKHFREAVEYRREMFKTHPRKYSTLVQICWKLNY